MIEKAQITYGGGVRSLEKLTLKKCLESDRVTYTPAESELLYITDTKAIYIGDNVTVGGIRIDASDVERETWSSKEASDIIQDENNRFVTDIEKGYWNAKEDALGYTAENISNKGVINGYASLDASGLVPSAQLPSYVDDVIEVDNYASLPTPGDEYKSKIFVTLDTNKTYRCSGSAWIYIASGAVDSVAGRTGIVTLTSSDVGLGNVNNTADANKSVSYATTAGSAGSVTNGVYTTSDQTISGNKTFSYKVTGKTAGSDTLAGFYSPSTGGTYSSMWTRRGTPFQSTVNHSGSSYAPVLGIQYEYTGMYSGIWSIGHLTLSAGNPGSLVIHHINSSGTDQRSWEFCGSDGYIKSTVGFQGPLKGNADTATTLIGDETNWASYRSRAVSNMLGWKNWGNGHVIFDASNSTSPTGTAVNNQDAAIPWSGTYPTLMGWNGATTYGVRVDSARVADSAATAGSANLANNATKLTSVFISDQLILENNVWIQNTRNRAIAVTFTLMGTANVSGMVYMNTTNSDIGQMIILQPVGYNSVQIPCCFIVPPAGWFKIYIASGSVSSGRKTVI